MDNKIHLVTFANKEPFIRSQQILNSTYERCNITTHTMWNQYMIYETDFYHKNANIIEKYKTIGFGLFIWKPYIISKKLEEIEEGEYIYYQDSSRYDFTGLTENLQIICDYMNKNNIELIPGFEKNSQNKYLIKQECLKYMGYDNNCIFLEKNHCHTSPLLFKKTPRTVQFINEWLEYCQIPECIIKNIKFHQCDQAIFNILLDKYDYKSLLYTFDKNESKLYNFYWKKMIEYINNENT